jgi:3-deoxy-D-manno-octulosonate 8-phosphate phosphatase (KDO 8-P phosphatase)
MKPAAEKFSKVKILFFDLDGVLNTQSENSTDKDFCNVLSEFCKKCSDYNLKVFVITGREDDEITKAVSEIDNCFIKTASVNKVQAAGEILLELQLNFDDAFFIGDNILDIPLLQRVGLKACPRGARREVKRIVDFIADGETCEEILSEVMSYIENSR